MVPAHSQEATVQIRRYQRARSVHRGCQRPFLGLMQRPIEAACLSLPIAATPSKCVSQTECLRSRLLASVKSSSLQDIAPPLRVCLMASPRRFNRRGDETKVTASPPHHRHCILWRPLTVLEASFLTARHGPPPAMMSQMVLYGRKIYRKCCLKTQFSSSTTAPWPACTPTQ